MPARRLDAVHRPPPGDTALLAVGVLAVGTSGPLMAACAAPALAIAFWRNGLAALLLLIWSGLRARSGLRSGGELCSLTRREWRLSVLAGVMLAAHFAAWVPSLSFTTVASATALVATQPVWAALIAGLEGSPVPARAWAGIALAVAGAAMLSGIDFTTDPRALFGNALAVLGGALAAIYMAVGGTARRTVTTTTYTTICYTTAAVVLLAVCLIGRWPLVGYSTATWVQLLALTAGAQLLGHSVFNQVLRTTSATVVSLAILFEIPLAALLAALFLDQRPPAAAIPAALLLVVGVAVVVSGRPVPEPAPVD